MKLTKAVSGIVRGDVSNHAIRNILAEISVKTYGKIIEEDIFQAMEFFG